MFKEDLEDVVQDDFETPENVGLCGTYPSENKLGN